MDLHSLPKEMLASILKYNDYPTIHKLKHTDSHINRVAKSYNIGTRLPAIAVRICGDEPVGYDWHAAFDITEETWETNQVLPDGWHVPFTYVFRYTRKDGSHIVLIDKLLDRIAEVSKSMNFFQFDYAPFDDEFITVLLKHIKRLRNITKIDMSNTDVACSITMAKRLISSLKKLNYLSIENSKTSIAAFCHSEILEGRKWDRIEFMNYTWDYSFKHYGLNDEFLLKVVKNCNNFYAAFRFPTCMFFTVNGVIELIKALVEEGTTPECIFLSSVQCDDPTFRTAKKQLKALPGLRFSFKTQEYTTQDGLNRVYQGCRSEVFFPTNKEEGSILFYMKN